LDALESRPDRHAGDPAPVVAAHPRGLGRPGAPGGAPAAVRGRSAMSARKIGLLFLILGLGAGLETAWSVRNHVDLGPEGCRVLGGRFYGPSWAFEDELRQAVPAGARVEVQNAFGSVRVTTGAPGEVKVGLRKLVFLPTRERAREFAGRVSARASVDREVVRVSTNRDEVGREDRVGLETHLDPRVPP